MFANGVYTLSSYNHTDTDVTHSFDLKTANDSKTLENGETGNSSSQSQDVSAETITLNDSGSYAAGGWTLTSYSYSDVKSDDFSESQQAASTTAEVNILSAADSLGDGYIESHGSSTTDDLQQSGTYANGQYAVVIAVWVYWPKQP
jgi:hypothetical protein